MVLKHEVFLLCPVFLVSINNDLQHPLFVMCSFKGLSLLGTSGKMGIDLSAMHALTFASLIAAVDPVAVSTMQNSLKCMHSY